jgi:hypothetical protein
MEPENLKLVWEESSAAAVLFSSGKAGEQSIALVRRLATDASARYPQLMDLQFAPISLPVSRLETWTYLMAAESVRQWRTLVVEESETETYLMELGLISPAGTSPLLDALNQVGTETPLVKGLNERIQALYQQPQENFSALQYRTWIVQESANLADWFLGMPTSAAILSQSLEEIGGCIVQLQLYAPTLHDKTLKKLKTCFAQLRRSGSQVVLNQLNLLSQALQNVRADYEGLRRDNLHKENAAWRAYDNLMAQSNPCKWVFFQKDHLDWKAALRALKLAYTCKLEAEAYGLASQLVGDLIQQTHRYMASLAQTDTLLSNLQKWYLEHCPSESVLPSLLRSFLVERMNPLELRRSLEIWAGHPLEQWGAAKSLPREVLREQILTRIRPLCLEVYGECCTAVTLAAAQPSAQLHRNKNSLDSPTIPLNLSMILMCLLAMQEMLV